jgi:hypothetical protein
MELRVSPTAKNNLALDLPLIIAGAVLLKKYWDYQKTRGPGYGIVGLETWEQMVLRIGLSFERRR